MERLKRKPFQGVTNIIRFNGHYYIIAFILIVVLFFAKNYLHHNLNIIASIILSLSILSILLSLAVSLYIYDYSGLYLLDWLNFLNISRDKKLVNITAGFDETSSILAHKYPTSSLKVFDFYDPSKHTEVSIERARKVYPAFPGTESISTSLVRLQSNSVDYIFLLFAAHEIRNNTERINFFKQLADALTTDGRIIVVEHQRDFNNFIAYNLGFFHFLSEKNWIQTFAKSGLLKDTETKINPFIKIFVLKKYGNVS